MKNNIKYLRRSKEYDLTQKELAKKLGISYMTLVNIELNGTASLNSAFKISKFFGLPIEQIFFE